MQLRLLQKMGRFLSLSYSNLDKVAYIRNNNCRKIERLSISPLSLKDILITEEYKNVLIIAEN
jgi:hypothetical protein